MFSFNHSRFNANEHTLSASNVAHLSLAWSVAPSNPAINPSLSAPAIANGVVYITNRDTTPTSSLVAYDMKTGKTLWQKKLLAADVGNTDPAVVNGTLYLSDANMVQAFNAKNGALIWTSDVAPSGSPTVDNGTIYVDSNLSSSQGNATIYALNAKTGKTIWAVPTAQVMTEEAPAVANGIVYAGDVGNNLYAINATTGKQV